MKLLKHEQQESYENAKIYYVCKEKFEDKYAKDKKYLKVRDHCHYKKYSIPKEFTITFHNGSNYHYYFMMKELAGKFEGKFSCYKILTKY